MADLSLNARIVAGASFGFSPGASLRYGMVESVPSPEMQAALDELVAAAIITRDDEPHGAVKYVAASGIDFTPYRKEVADHVFAGTSPAIRLFVKRCVVCGNTGRVGPFFPDGMQTICGNCDTAINAIGREVPK